jgi:hypothetical protein
MKLRLKGNSLRLRVSPSELARLLEKGRIEETIRFASEPNAKLTYALEHTATEEAISVRYRAQEVTIVLSTRWARSWAEGSDVGVSGTVRLDSEVLDLLVEKDFACLEGTDQDNKDTFSNPRSRMNC